MKNKHIFIFAILCVVVISLFIIGVWFLQSRDTDDPDEKDKTVQQEEESVTRTNNNEDNKKDMLEIKNQDDIPLAETNYRVTLNTEKGDIVLELTKDTPKTTGNFVTLAKSGFYDNTIFHRVIDGFMIQGGDPEGTGTGGPGYRFDDEPFDGEYTRGTVAMANAGPNTNGSQFFIMHEDYALQPNYTIFGKVVEGMDVVDEIAKSEVETGSTGEPSKPVDPVKVLSVNVEEK
jgi:peptidylprolyl isomerase